MEFLLTNIKQSRNNIKNLLTKKKVLVDGIVVSQYNYVLKRKQIVSISSIPIRQESLFKHLNVIYEDDTFIAINKPNGLLTIASDKEKQLTAYRMISDYVASGDKYSRVYITHRLDKETSGVLLISKDEKMRDELQDDWNKNVKTRGYLAIVEGKMAKKKGTIESYLLETSTNLMYSTTNKKEGKKAITHYEVIKENKYYSMLRIKLDTGRKNQIRVHLKELGHPVIGDDKYGSKLNPIKRLGLHAELLEFYHPKSKELVSIKARAPKEFTTIMK